jgi:hypothetical protein
MRAAAAAELDLEVVEAAEEEAAADEEVARVEEEEAAVVDPAPAAVDLLIEKRYTMSTRY